MEMQRKDRIEKEKADSKNAVEEYVYYMRDKLSDALAEFITDEVIFLFGCIFLEVCPPRFGILQELSTRGKDLEEDARGFVIVVGG